MEGLSAFAAVWMSVCCARCGKNISDQIWCACLSDAQCSCNDCIGYWPISSFSRRAAETVSDCSDSGTLLGNSGLLRFSHPHGLLVSGIQSNGCSVDCLYCAWRGSCDPWGVVAMAYTRNKVRK